MKCVPQSRAVFSSQLREAMAPSMTGDPVSLLCQPIAENLLKHLGAVAARIA